MNNNYLQQIQAGRLNQMEQMQPNLFSPMTFNSPQPVAKKTNVIYSLVDGYSGAQNFMLMPGEVGLLFDASKNEFYKKSIDEMGMMSIKKYDYKEVPIPTSETPGIASNDAAINKRLDSLENAINKLLEVRKEEPKEEVKREVKK